MNDEMNDDDDEERRKFKDLIRAKHELEKKNLLKPDSTPEKEIYRYEELIRNKNKKKTKDKGFNTAFCIEVKQDDDKFLPMGKEPVIKIEGAVWREQIREKERKMRREETRIAQERLKIIDKRSRYGDIAKDALSPPTRAYLSPEPYIYSSSPSKHELVPINNRDIGKFSDNYKMQKEGENTKRLIPRSLSRRELSPPPLILNSNRSPFIKKSAVVKGDLT
ncbi:hypothetical protein SteCoe_14116 [Stentor coeruleus]|uniref:Uncharacterized protein n=1 Tax=Stentor coeruleus TaxID=5963 RepID=A0A1R2C6U2_9CILI|nr:hypothetical protein SteCoe_14116 [Stentor coeruleus]